MNFTKVGLTRTNFNLSDKLHQLTVYLYNFVKEQLNLSKIYNFTFMRRRAAHRKTGEHPKKRCFFTSVFTFGIIICICIRGKKFYLHLTNRQAGTAFLIPLYQGACVILCKRGLF